jgi:hypothetical protein
MVAQPTSPSNAERIRQIATLALNDAVEITVLIALMKDQNEGGVNKKLNDEGAGKAGGVIRNALLARLVMMIARAYPKPKPWKGDMHLHEAARLLEIDNVTRQIFGSGEGKEYLSKFESQWIRCRDDHRRKKINDFRDKYTAHLKQPEEIDEATYAELFAFGALTAEAMESLALATRVAVNPISSDPAVMSSAHVFWAKWC